ncbi:MAG: hypothetical protein L0216_09420 [Planctomycetales bacterium]|nr:hypothetical protein [Planctomycetales bacterium]
MGTTRGIRRGIGIAVAAAAVFAFAPAAGAQAPSGSEDRALMGPKDKLSIDVKDKPLPDVVSYVRQETGKNILLGKNAEGKRLEDVWPPITVTVRFDDVPWEQALDIIAEAAGCLVEKKGAIWEVYQPPVVTIEMEKADLRDVVQAIAAVSGANVVVGSDVPKDLPVSVRLRNIPWFKALEAVVKAVEMTLVKEPDADIWIIRDPEKLKKQLETRVFRLKYIRPEEEYGAQLTKNPKVSAPLQKVVTTTERLKNFTLKAAVEKGLTMDSGGKPIGGVDYDIVSNAFVISDVPTKLDEIQKIIDALDVEPAQFQIDVKFVQTTRTDFMDVGVNWGQGDRGVSASGNMGSMRHRLPFDLGRGGFDDQIGLSTDSSGTAFARGPTTADVGTGNYTFGILDFSGVQATMNFLKRDGLVEVTQRPSITVTDNFVATIFVGETVRFAETKATAGQQGGLEFTLQEAPNSPVSTGFQLLVIPHQIPGTRRVLVTLVPTLDALSSKAVGPRTGFDTFTSGNNTIDLPRVTSSTIVTRMLLEDGETAVLGGLIDEQETETIRKIPLLGDIPILGYLFKSVTTNRAKSNIVIFVTVRVVRSQKEAREALEAQLRSRQREVRSEYYQNVRRQELAPEPEPAKEAPKGAAPGGTSEPPKGAFYAPPANETAPAAASGTSSGERPRRWDSGR